MTGKELYTQLTQGEKVPTWKDLPGMVKEFYEQCANTRLRNDHEEQGTPIHNGKQTCCGWCSGHCC